jgi:hypothetical protein
MCKINFDQIFNQMADADVQVYHRDLLVHALPLTFFTISIDTDSKKKSVGQI